MGISLYLFIKWIHVLSSTILFGTGLGSAFYMFTASRSRDVAGIYYAARHVVTADWVFTTPAVLIQPATGLWMVHMMGYSFTAFWIKWAFVLYFFTGACWLPVVWMQIRMRDMAKHALHANESLPPLYWTLEKYWIALGCLAFTAVMAIFWLMVMKP